MLIKGWGTNQNKIRGKAQTKAESEEEVNGAQVPYLVQLQLCLAAFFFNSLVR